MLRRGRVLHGDLVHPASASCLGCWVLYHFATRLSTRSVPAPERHEKYVPSAQPHRSSPDRPHRSNSLPVTPLLRLSLVCPGKNLSRRAVSPAFSLATSTDLPESETTSPPSSHTSRRRMVPPHIPAQALRVFLGDSGSGSPTAVFSRAALQANSLPSKPDHVTSLLTNVPGPPLPSLPVDQRPPGLPPTPSNPGAASSPLLPTCLALCSLTVTLDPHHFLPWVLRRAWCPRLLRSPCLPSRLGDRLFSTILQGSAPGHVGGFPAGVISALL